MVGHSLEENVGSTHITVDDGIVALVQVVQSPGNVHEDRKAVSLVQLLLLVRLSEIHVKKLGDDERRGLVKHCPNEQNIWRDEEKIPPPWFTSLGVWGLIPSPPPPCLWFGKVPEKTAKQLDLGSRLSIFMDIARALNYLHQPTILIIHRDVVLPTILLERMPPVKEGLTLALRIRPAQVTR